MGTVKFQVEHAITYMDAMKAHNTPAIVSIVTEKAHAEAETVHIAAITTHSNLLRPPIKNANPFLFKRVLTPSDQHRLLKHVFRVEFRFSKRSKIRVRTSCRVSETEWRCLENR